MRRSERPDETVHPPATTVAAGQGLRSERRSIMSDSHSPVQGRKKQKTPPVEYVEVPEEYKAALVDHLSEKRTTTRLDLDSKTAVLKASSSVVALRSFSGECGDDDDYLHQCSGMIVSCHEDGHGTYLIGVITAATVFANSDASVNFVPALAPDLKVQVRPCNGRIYHGVLTAHDFHYNIALVNFKSDLPFQGVSFKYMYVNTMHFNPPFQLKRHQDSCDISQDVKLCPGEKVVAVGRDFDHNTLIAEKGAFSALRCKFDCPELLMTSCTTSVKFTGGPLINHIGDVIGIVFCLWNYSGFLPSNIISRCLELLTRQRDVHRPHHGVKLRDLYATNVALLEKIMQNPGACRGVIIEKVKKGSPAELAGLLPYDVIIQFGGSAVKSSLELYASIWDKTGESVEVEVISTNGEHKKLNLVVQHTDPQRYNRWPLFDPLGS